MNTVWVASSILLWIIVASLAVIMVGVLRQLGLIQLRIGPDPGVLITPEGLPRGAKAPAFEAVDVRMNRRVSLADFGRGRLLLVFLSTGCSACADLVPHVNAVAHDHRNEVKVLTICHGTKTQCQEFATHHGVRQALLADPSNEIAQLYEVRVTPFTFLLDTDGTVLLRGVTNTWSHLEALLQEEGTFQKSSWQPAPSDLEATSMLPGGGRDG